MAIACQTGEIADDLFYFVCSMREDERRKKYPRRHGALTG